MKKNSPQLHIEEELQEKKIDIEQLDGEDGGLGHWTVNPQFFTFPFFLFALLFTHPYQQQIIFPISKLRRAIDHNFIAGLYSIGAHGGGVGGAAW